MKFEKLVATIEQTHNHFQQQAVKAVNVALTLRNWLIGCYIVEFEQKGEDRARYGDNLFTNLANRIALKGLSETNLRLSRQFYNTYPEVEELLFSNFSNLLPSSIRQSLSDEVQDAENKGFVIHQSPTDELKSNSKKQLQNPNNY